MLPRLCASPVVSLRTFEWQTDPCAPRESVWSGSLLINANRLAGVH